MPLGLITIRSAELPAPGTRADTLPEVQATSPLDTRAACSRHTSARARWTAPRMPSGTLFTWPPSRALRWLREACPRRRDTAASLRVLAAFGPAAAAFRDCLEPTSGASRSGSFLGAGQHPVAQGTQPVQHLVGAPAEVVVQGHVLRVQLVVHGALAGSGAYTPRCID